MLFHVVPSNHIPWVKRHGPIGLLLPQLQEPLRGCSVAKAKEAGVHTLRPAKFGGFFEWKKWHDVNDVKKCVWNDAARRRVWIVKYWTCSEALVPDSSSLILTHTRWFHRVSFTTLHPIQPAPRGPWKGVAHKDVTRLIPWADKWDENWKNRSVQRVFWPSQTCCQEKLHDIDSMGYFIQLTMFAHDLFHGCQAGVERYHLHNFLDLRLFSCWSFNSSCHSTRCASGEKWHQAPLLCIWPQGRICIQVDYHVDAFVGQFLEFAEQKMSVWLQNDRSVWSHFHPAGTTLLDFKDKKHTLLTIWEKNWESEKNQKYRCKNK